MAKGATLTCDWVGMPASNGDARVFYAGRSSHPYAPHLWVGECACGFLTVPELERANAWVSLDAHRGYKRPRRGATEGSTTNTAP